MLPSDRRGRLQRLHRARLRRAASVDSVEPRLARRESSLTLARAGPCDAADRAGDLAVQAPQLGTCVSFADRTASHSILPQRFFMSELVNPEFNATANLRLDGMIEAFHDASPAARYLATSTSIDNSLFVRHTIETILRIRLARIADSKVIQHFTRTNPFAAQKWSKYTEQQMLHDRLFLKDLKILRVDDELVYGTDPLIATKLLQGYLYYTIEHEGPRGVLSKSYFVEYITKKAQALWNSGVRRVIGDPEGTDAEVHLDHEMEDDYTAFVWNVLMAVVRTPEDEARVLYHLEVYYGLFVAYFNELSSNVDMSPPPLDPAGAAVWAARRAALFGGKGGP